MFRLTAALAGALLTVAAAAAPLIFSLKNRALDESSGLALSLLDPQILWSHNDSGGLPALYRVGLQGEDLGRVDVPLAMNFDWEDIAAFRYHGAPALLIGDVGDNYSIRDEVSVYAVADPGRSNRTQLLWKLAFQYEDGPRDCEALAVDPVSGDILLISKREQPPALYRLPLPDAPPTRPAIAKRIATLPQIPRAGGADFKNHPIAYAYLSMPTALDISRDGRFAVVITPKDAYLYLRRGAESWARTFARLPRTIAQPWLPQTEGGAISADGRWLYISSERGPKNFARVALP